MGIYPSTPARHFVPKPRTAHRIFGVKSIPTHSTHTHAHTHAYTHRASPKHEPKPERGEVTPPKPGGVYSLNLSGETTEKAPRRAAAQRRSPSRRAGAASVYRLFTNSRRVCDILTLRHPFRAKQGLDAKASIFPFWYQTWVFAGIPAKDFRETRLRLQQLLNNSKNGTKTAFFW